jgi:hypothetical protein
MKRRFLLVTSLVVLVASVASPARVAAQQEAPAIMVAAARWALRSLPSGTVRLDPHRTGDGPPLAAAQAVARELGAELGTLEQIRVCQDVTRPETCRLEADVLLAVAAPRVDRDRARVRVYAWHRTGSAREPVARRTWELELVRTDGAWRVTGEVPAR